jgi:hypothetical protein
MVRPKRMSWVSCLNPTYILAPIPNPGILLVTPDREIATALSFAVPIPGKSNVEPER